MTFSEQIGQLLRKRKFTQQELDVLRVEFESKLKEFRLGYLSINHGATEQEQDAHWTLLKELEKIGFILDIDPYDRTGEKSEICIKCNKNKTIPSEYSSAERGDLFCKQCLDEWDKEKYRRFCETLRKKEEANPLEKYAREIVNIAAYYEIPYEMRKKDQEELSERRKNMDLNTISEHSRMYNILHIKKKPEDMTEEQWQKERRKARDYMRECNDSMEERRFAFNNTPIRAFESKLWGVRSYCECTAEGLRQGVCCDICKLVQKTDEYMLRLFKDKAQGRIN